MLGFPLTRILIRKLHCMHDMFVGLFRIAEAQQEGAPLVDVDDSYIYKKFKTLIEEGMQVSPLPCPTPLISG